MENITKNLVKISRKQELDVCEFCQEQHFWVSKRVLHYGIVQGVSSKYCNNAAKMVKKIRTIQVSNIYPK